MRSPRLLVVDPSKELALFLQYSLRDGEYELELAGSSVAALHKIREGNLFLLIWENRKDPDPRATVHILREAQKASLPMLLLSSWQLPEEHLQKLRTLVDPLTPPLYPFRLLRELQLFMAMEETVYVYRSPQRRLKGVTFWFLDQCKGAGEGVARILREYGHDNGIRFLASEHEESLLPLVQGQGTGILFLYGENEEEIRRVLLRFKPFFQKGGVVPLLPPERCAPGTLYPLLSAEPFTVLPWQFPPEDLESFTSLLRQRF